MEYSRNSIVGRVRPREIYLLHGTCESKKKKKLTIGRYYLLFAVVGGSLEFDSKIINETGKYD